MLISSWLNAHLAKHLQYVYQMAKYHAYEFLVITWSLKGDIVFVYVQFELVVVIDLAFMGAQQLSCFFLELQH